MKYYLTVIQRIVTFIKYCRVSRRLVDYHYVYIYKDFYYKEISFILKLNVTYSYQIIFGL